MTELERTLVRTGAGLDSIRAGAKHIALLIGLDGMSRVQVELQRMMERTELDSNIAVFAMAGLAQAQQDLMQHIADNEAGR